MSQKIIEGITNISFKTQIEMDLNNLVNLSKETFTEFEKENTTEHDFMILYQRMNKMIEKATRVKEKAYFAVQTFQERKIEE